MNSSEFDGGFSNKAKTSHKSPTENLPSVRKLRGEARALGVINKLFRNDELKNIIDQVNSDLDRIVYTVDRFYELLGSGNWVFSDSLSLERMARVVSKTTSAEAEEELISYLKEKATIDLIVNRLRRFPDMRPRMDLLQKAERDYLEGRYYSSVLVVVSIMDGFVNDAFKEERRGLHARNAEEMQAEDSVASLLEGLPSMQSVFAKSCHKRIDEPIYDIYRHALMHGMATNFDNVTIASKAWCMLAAVGDWIEAKSKEKKDETETIPLKDAIEKCVNTIIKNSERKIEQDGWNGHTVDLSKPSDEDAEFIKSCEAFLNAWQSKNYGYLGAFFYNVTDNSPRMMAGEARAIFSEYPIDKFTIEKIERPAPSVALATTTVVQGKQTWTPSLRFIRTNKGEIVADWETGDWKLVRYAVDPFKDTNENPSTT